MSDEFLPELTCADLDVIDEMEWGAIHIRDEDSHDMGTMEGRGQRRRHESDSEQDDDDDSQAPIIGFTIQEINNNHFERFNAQQRVFRVRFKENEFSGSAISSIMASLYLSIAEILREVNNHTQPRDFIRVIIFSEGMEHAISTQVVRVEDMSPELIMTTVMKHIQSNREIRLDGSFTLDFLLVPDPQGGTGFRIINPDLDKKLKRSIIQIRNEDDICMARAIVVAHARITNHTQIKYICDSRKPLQKSLALDLHEKASVPLGKCGVMEARRFEDYLDIQINIVSLQDGNKINYRGPDRDKKIYLWRRKGEDGKHHYDVITSMAGFTGSKFYCHYCDKGYEKKWMHRCEQHCSTCGRDKCLRDASASYCLLCRKFCQNTTCMQEHAAICSKSWYCGACQRIFPSNQFPKEKHRCGEHICKGCKKSVLANHLCYLPWKEMKPPSDRYIYFDFEADQSAGGVHVANYCIAQYSNGEEFIFSGYDTENKFGQWLFQRKHKGFTAIAHCMKSYDGYFLLSYLLKNGITPNVIMNGAKIMSIEIPSHKIRVIDSFNFLPMALSKLPSTFGLDTISKGYFPHLMNDREHQDYIGPIPPPEAYGCDSMLSREGERFLEWHQKKKKEGYIFNFRDEIEKYCRSDVDILRRACLQFRELLLQVADCDPFQYLTIASVCHAIYKNHFMKPNTIAMVPSHGYNVESFSKASIEWLDFTAHDRRIYIRHALNHPDGEKKIGSFRVDGFHEETRTIFEFNGCLFHGCQRCHDPEDIHPHLEFPMKRLYERTKDRQKYLENLDYEVIVIWECEWKERKKEDEVQKFLERHEVVSRLDCREAFYGGRTNAAVLKYDVKGNEKIKYIDFTSLYPYTNKYCEYPVGHPEIITRDFEDVSAYFGFIKCLILPPRGLYHPVLPYRSNKKLLFPLCRTCADNLQQEPCQHTDESRAIQGVWVTEEVKKAVEMGYTVIKIYEVYHFPQKSRDLFKAYIDTFLKIKQEASGWPSECLRENEKEAYIKRYEQHEGIKLEKDKIAKNPGLRAVAKLALNSFWGRFGMRENLSRTTFVRSTPDMNRFLADPKIKINGMSIINESVMEMTWGYRDEHLPQQTATNIFVAAFTTCYARMKLYSTLQELGKAVLYYDTDSVIYVSDGTNDPPLGDFLGEFTDELDGDHIVNFISGGPKNYAYRTSHGKESLKVRGFTLDHAASQKITFDSMHQLISNFRSAKGGAKRRKVLEAEHITIINPQKIIREKKGKRLITVEERKRYQVVYDKRVLQQDFTTLPYGF
jgi:hypothetical protein